MDVALLQEHFRGGADDSLYLFGKDWWSFSSVATSVGSGRKSGGCAVLGQPCLSSRGDFSILAEGYVEYSFHLGLY